MKIGFTAYLFLLAIILPINGLTQLVGKMDAQKEIEIGRQASHEMDILYGVSHNTVNQERVRRIGQSLVDGLPQKAYPFEFKVLSSPQFNAVCLPGGFMFVFEGLLAKIPSDDALAFVMGHEIAHAAHRHAHDLFERAKGPSVIAIIADIATGTNVGSKLAGLLFLKYSRDHETDADRTGIELAWTAGFDPQGAVDATKIMHEMDKGKDNREFLSSHPSSKSRLIDMTAIAATLKSRERPPIKNGSNGTIEPVTNLIGNLPEIQNANNPWFPLSVGSTWTYKVTAPTSSSSNYEVRVVGRVSNFDVSGSSVFRAETLLGKSSPVAYQLYTSNGAVLRRNRISSQSSPWIVEFIIDSNSAEVALLPKESFRKANEFSKIESEAINLPCGLFKDVLKLSYKAAGNSYTVWFARDVGMIKRVCGETSVTETLFSYSLSK